MLRPSVVDRGIRIVVIVLITLLICVGPQYFNLQSKAPLGTFKSLVAPLLRSFLSSRAEVSHKIEKWFIYGRRYRVKMSILLNRLPI